MKLQEKNSSFQSCLYCNEGGAFCRIDLDNGDTAYVCKKHREEIESIKELVIKGKEKEPSEKMGLLTKALNYIKGG